MACIVPLLPASLVGKNPADLATLLSYIELAADPFARTADGKDCLSTMGDEVEDRSLGQPEPSKSVEDPSTC